MVTADHFQNIFVTPETPSVLIQQSVHFPRSPQPLANTRLFWICVRACMLSRFSCVRLFATLWTVVCQAPPSMEVSGQEYWSGLPCPPPGDLPESGIKSESLMSPALAGRFFTSSATWEAPCSGYFISEGSYTKWPFVSGFSHLA